MCQYICQLQERFAVFYQKVCHRDREAMNAHYKLVDRTWNRNKGRVLLSLLVSPRSATQASLHGLNDAAKLSVRSGKTFV